MNTLLIAAMALTFLPAQTERNLSGSTPAAGITSVEIRADVGSITVTAAPIQEVRVSVIVTAKTQWHFFSRETGDPSRVQLRQAKYGNSLEISLSGDSRNLEEQWKIEVPENVSARLALDVGKIRVNGIRGGIDARTDVGPIEIDVPEGSISATSHVGDIRITTRTPSYGDVDTRTSVGHLNLAMDGHALDHKRSPGAGDTFKLRGPGKDRIRVHTDVGAVNLKIR